GDAAAPERSGAVLQQPRLRTLRRAPPPGGDPPEGPARGLPRMPRRADDPGPPGAAGPASDAARRTGARPPLTPRGAPARNPSPVGPGLPSTPPRPPVDPAVRE